MIFVEPASVAQAREERQKDCLGAGLATRGAPQRLRQRGRKRRLGRRERVRLSREREKPTLEADRQRRLFLERARQRSRRDEHRFALDALGETLDELRWLTGERALTHQHVVALEVSDTRRGFRRSE